MAATVRRVAAPYKDIEKTVCAMWANPCNNPSVSASPSQLPCRGAVIAYLPQIPVSLSVLGLLAAAAVRRVAAPYKVTAYSNEQGDFYKV